MVWRLPKSTEDCNQSFEFEGLKCLMLRLNHPYPLSRSFFAKLYDGSHIASLQLLKKSGKERLQSWRACCNVKGMQMTPFAPPNAACNVAAARPQTVCHNDEPVGQQCSVVSCGFGCGPATGSLLPS